MGPRVACSCSKRVDASALVCSIAVTILYVDGESATACPESWPELRSDGVDEITIANSAGSSVFRGHSSYWLYKEGSMWVAGQASFGYNPTLPPEVLFLADGTQSQRQREFVPDLKHRDLKLGWWRR